MFPYPSGAGLHVGHPLGYIGTDVLGRYQRMTGHNVLHALGFDAFGLPAEQYAVQTGSTRGPPPRPTSPATSASCAGWAWRTTSAAASRPPTSSSTAGPSGSSCRSTALVRPSSSGRARPIDELEAEFAAGPRATPDGRPWAELTRSSGATLDRLPPAGLPLRGAGQLVPRAGHRAGQRGGHRRRAQRPRQLPGVQAQPAPVDDADHRVRRPAGRRPGPAGLAGLGQGHAAQLDRPQPGRPGPRSPVVGAPAAIEVFTTRPDTLFGATFMVLAPEHPLVDQIVPGAWPMDTDPRWTGGATTPPRRSPPTAPPPRARPTWSARRARTRPASSPAPWPSTRSTAQPIPVFVADYVLMGYGTGAIMAVPGQDQRDWDFAEAFDLPIVRTVAAARGLGRARPYTGDGPAINSPTTSSAWTGLGVAEAKRRSSTWLVGKGAGRGRRAVQAARLAVLPAALLGRAVPDRLRRARPGRRCPTTSCPWSCPTSTTTRRGPSTRTTPTPSRSRRWRAPRTG